MIRAMNERTPTLAENLAESKGMTAIQLADAVGLSESQVRNILTGRTKAPNVVAAQRIASLLNIPIERLWPPWAA